MGTRKVPLIPLSFVVFPHQSGVLNLSDKDLVSLLHAVYHKGNRYAGVFLKKEDTDQREIVSSVSDVYGVGTLVKIRVFQDQNEKLRLSMKGFKCISLKGILPWSSDGCPQSELQPANHDAYVYSVFSHYRSQTPNSDEKFLMAQVEDLNDESDAKPEVLEALCQEIKKIINDIALILGPEVQVNYPSASDFGILAYKLASSFLPDPHKKQEVLEENKIGKRLRLVSLLLNELKVQHLEAHHIKVLNKYKIIHDKCVDIQNNESYPKAVRKAINTVMTERERKYEEYNKCKKYLKTLISLPWNDPPQKSIDLEHAKRSLDADLIGLEDVKKGILDFIQGDKRKIPFIHGPPGAGKKSIGKAIARALNRKCAIVDLKYMKNVAELEGIELTHDDGRPGKIVESLMETGTMNPVILLNGVDMVWKREENSICCALFDLIWERKSSFKNNYLRFKVDLSKVLFVCIASDTNKIPKELHNNLFVMEVTGYFLHEKLEIAKKCLIPAQLLIDDWAIVQLVLEYCQKLGLNHLKRMIESIAVSQGRDRIMTVNKENVESYVQESKRHRVHETTPAGVVRGLAYDHESSSAFYIEALAFSEGNGRSDRCTGNGERLFKDSVDVAVSYVKAKIPQLMTYWFHIHAPPGATPKNGTSAGIAIVTAIMSWILQTPVPQKMAMTGEVTESGKVIPVSGIRQKMIAAEKEGVTSIILPKGNKNDYENLPKQFKEGRTVFFVDNCIDVFRVAFPDHDHIWNTF